ncbi:MAG: hypothetical protein IJJ75_07900 [Firmicutes bacterium]|nr:hypothetical protein [Bacillota bacterium]
MSKITGLKSTSKKNFQLDAGALYKNWSIGTDTPANASSKLIGATQGGATIAITPEIRQMEVDGAKGAVKGLEVIESWAATLTATVKEITPASIQLALADSTVSTTAVTGYTKIVPGEDLTDEDYLTNVAWVGKLLGASDPIVIILKNAVSLNGWNLQVQDKNEGGVPLVLTAHYDVADLDDVPIEIYMPTVS